MWCPAGERGHPITVLYEKARNWWIGSDPGLLRLRMATRTTPALACSLVMLDLLAKATGRPLAVALLGVVITVAAAAQTRSNIDALVAILDGAEGVTVNSATDGLDAAEPAARHQDGDGGLRLGTRHFLTAVQAVRQIERAIITAATDLGAGDSLKVASPAAS